MRPRINLALPALVLIPGLGACTSYESEYEKGVYDYEPLYCYQSLAAIDCRREPYHRDSARLVNYYGPAPGKYEPPAPPEASELQAPPEVKAVYRDPEPAPSATKAAAPQSDQSTGKSEAAAAREGSDWKQWLPLVSVAFGALQVVAAFVF